MKGLETQVKYLEPHGLDASASEFLWSPTMTLSRREFCAASALAVGSAHEHRAAREPFAFKYLVGSCMYGYLYVGEVFPEVQRCGAQHIDLWPKKHGNQREQLDGIGEERFVEMLTNHGVSVGCLTQYPLGPFGLQDEMRLAHRLGCRVIVTGGDGPKGLAGNELKSAVGSFVERMKPHLALAEEAGVTIAIENHANDLFESADALRYLHELSPSQNLGIALAPYHLPQDSLDRKSVV